MKRNILSNIFWYLQGNTRQIICTNRFLKYVVPKYIRQQVAIREESTNETCKARGSCKECGCKIPQLQYADKACYANCYPHMLGKKDFQLLQNGGCLEDDMLNITWKITDGKFNYNSIFRDRKGKA